MNDETARAWSAGRLLYRQNSCAIAASPATFPSRPPTSWLTSRVSSDRSARSTRSASASAFTAAGLTSSPSAPPAPGGIHWSRDLLADQATKEETPPDWCYVHNFADPHTPRLRKMPTGRAVSLREVKKKLVSELSAVLPAAFEREDYRAGREVIDQQFKHRHEEAFGALQRKAEQKGIALKRTPMGLALAPFRNGEVIPPDVFQRLPAEERARIGKEMDALQRELEATVRHTGRASGETRSSARS